jgi:hypothetical protein
MTKRRWLGLALALLVAVGVGLLARAAANVPAGLSYSGALENNGAVESGQVAHNFVFDLYDGATPLCTDTRTATMVNNGRFDLANLFSSSCTLDSYLGTKTSLQLRITVDGQVLSPNQPLGTVPFAARARIAETAENATALQGVPVASAAPAANQALVFNAGQYSPTGIVTSVGTGNGLSSSGGATPSISLTGGSLDPAYGGNRYGGAFTMTGPTAFQCNEHPHPTGATPVTPNCNIGNSLLADPYSSPQCSCPAGFTGWITFQFYDGSSTWCQYTCMR